MRPALFDAALFFDGLVGGGDAVEALAGLLLVVLAHVAHLGVELSTPIYLAHENLLSYRCMCSCLLFNWLCGHFSAI